MIRPREWITYQEAATYLGVSRTTVERYCLDGYLTYRKLPPKREGGQLSYYLVSVESLESFMAEYTHEAVPAEKRKGRRPILTAVR